jgi:hypothetical protein
VTPAAASGRGGEARAPLRVDGHGLLPTLGDGGAEAPGVDRDDRPLRVARAVVAASNAKMDGWVGN